MCLMLLSKYAEAVIVYTEFIVSVEIIVSPSCLKKIPLLCEDSTTMEVILKDYFWYSGFISLPPSGIGASWILPFLCLLLLCNSSFVSLEIWNYSNGGVFFVEPSISDLYNSDGDVLLTKLLGNYMIATAGKVFYFLFWNRNLTHNLVLVFQLYIDFSSHFNCDLLGNCEHIQFLIQLVSALTMIQVIFFYLMMVPNIQ